MPRLSLYRPEKGNDYKFIDRQASEMFQVGGTDVYVHKYMGPSLVANGTADQPTIDSYNVKNIQDLLFLENRDRKYDPSIYRIRGVYNVQDLDFNLSQFGLFLDNDTLYMTIHINDFVNTVGRKPISGDVLEIPHLKDEFALNDLDVSLPRYYVISDVGRAAEGFSPTWYPHLYRLKLTKISDGQQYKEIFDQKIVDPVTGEETNNTLRELLSTQQKVLDINDQLIAQAEADAPKSGYETRHLYTLAVDASGHAALESVDDTSFPPDSSSTNIDASRVLKRPKRSGYQGYLVGDGVPENGVDFGHGIQFPNNPYDGDFFLRTDFLPNRLFRYDGARWVRREDDVRMTMTNTDTRSTLKGTFINNSNKVGVGFIASDVYRVEEFKVTASIATVGTDLVLTVSYMPPGKIIKTGYVFNLPKIPTDANVYNSVEIESILSGSGGIGTYKLVSTTGITTVSNRQITLIGFKQHLLSQTYVAGMFANVNFGDSLVPSVTASSGTGGKVLLTFSEAAPTDYEIEWQLYSGSTNERVAISKALKPKADL